MQPARLVQAAKLLFGVVGGSVDGCWSECPWNECLYRTSQHGETRDAWVVTPESHALGRHAHGLP